MSKLFPALHSECFCSASCLEATLWSDAFAIRIDFSSVLTLYQGVYESSIWQRRLKMIATTENALMNTAWFFATYFKENSSRYVHYLQLYHHHGGILVLYPSGVLKDIEMFRLYSVVLLVGYDPVLCSLPVMRSQGVVWSPFVGSDTAFLGNQLAIGQVFYVPPLQTNKRLKTASSKVVVIPRRETRWIPGMYFVSVGRCEARRWEYGVATVSATGGGSNVE